MDVRRKFTLLSAGTLAIALVSLGPNGGAGAATPSGSLGHPAIDCSRNTALCTEVGDSESVWGEGHYVGHDEPSLLFYSQRPGSGNRMQYSGMLPKEPPPRALPGLRSYDFMLYPALWFGMAMCDTQSYPLTNNQCAPNSDSNVRPAGDPTHPGAAYMELQFYPPGYVQQFDGFSCSAKQWCVALTIDSVSQNPVTGKQLNDTCAARVGLEYVNFAYLTRDGTPQGPPNPVQFDPVASGKPQPGKALFLNQGDRFTVTMHDTDHGLQAVVTDQTTHQRGSMTASASNGFGQVKFAPNPSKDCVDIPADFHPMYSTSSPSTTVPWAAATYNVAIDTEIGHFDYCSSAPKPFASCTGSEGSFQSGIEPTDFDDNYCFPASSSTLVRVNGCLDSNIGFDGTSYLRDWPNGDRFLRPTPTIFTSPTTGEDYRHQYSQVAFNTDLPRIEDSPGYGGSCNRSTGAGCTIIPKTDDGAQAQFYPYYTSGHALGGCAWTIGQSVRNFTTRDYGRNNEYGQILPVTYIAGPNGATVTRFNDYQNVLPNNPCPRPHAGKQER
jgi:hypothetical protein